MANLVPIQDHREADRSISITTWTWTESLHRHNRGLESGYEGVRAWFKDYFYDQGTFEAEKYPERYWIPGK